MRAYSRQIGSAASPMNGSGNAGRNSQYYDSDDRGRQSSQAYTR